MPKFYFPVACDIRAYGSITVEAETEAEAIAKINAQYIAKHFELSGDADDLDYNHPNDIWIEYVRNEDTDKETELEWDVPPGSWQTYPYPDRAYSLLTILSDFEFKDEPENDECYEFYCEMKDIAGTIRSFISGNHS